MAARPQSNRRQFLTGQAALDAVSSFVPDAPVQSSGPEPHQADAECYLIQISRQAMACEFQILVNAGQHPGATEVALDGMDLIERLEEQLSWFRETSELSQINRVAASSPVTVEPGLFRLLLEAISLSNQTQGAFDITAGPLWRLWGFHRRESRLPTASEIREARMRIGPHQIQLDTQKQTIQFSREGVEINLGAIGKGYALDRCGEHLTAAGVDNFLVHGGQSSILARGSRLGGSGVEPSWTVALCHPLKPDRRLAEIHLRNRALGTSGSGNQFFHYGGKRYGHVLDPRTGQPANTLLSATVLAPTATQADALATAFFVMGVESSGDYCRSRPDIGALLVSAGEQAGAMEVVTFGLEPDDWQRLA